jgi:hypothetical protein
MNPRANDETGGVGVDVEEGTMQLVVVVDEAVAGVVLAQVWPTDLSVATAP